MDFKPGSSVRFLAPPADGASTAMRLPGAHELERPHYIDTRKVKPETRQELVEGHWMSTMPANPEHGDLHNRLDCLVGTHVAPGYTASTDLLTRAEEESDFATDVCVRKAGINPQTENRYLEELAFEVVHTQTMGDITKRAKKLVRIGVRRMIAVLVEKDKDDEVYEWSAKQEQWNLLQPDDTIEDRTLAEPLKVRAILDAAAADIAIVKALEAKNNPRILELKAEGELKGQIKTLLRQLNRRFGELPQASRAKIESGSAAQLEVWSDRVLTAQTLDEVLTE